MDKIRETIIVIPAYKPSERLISLVDEISGLGYRVLVVDDGSGQESEEIFNSVRRISRTRVLTHEVNLGKGAALKTAFNFIHNQDIGINYIVTLDADGQHLVSDMQRVAEASWRHPRWLILGSREFDKDVPFKSRLGNKITRTVFRMLSGRMQGGPGNFGQSGGPGNFGQGGGPGNFGQGGGPGNFGQGGDQSENSDDENSDQGRGPGNGGHGGGPSGGPGNFDPGSGTQDGEQSNNDSQSDQTSDDEGGIGV